MNDAIGRADMALPAANAEEVREILRHLHRDAIEVGGLSSRLARADIRELFGRALRETRDG